MKNYYRDILKYKFTFFRLFLSLVILFLWGLSSRYMPFFIPNMYIEMIVEFILLLFSFYLIFKTIMLDFNKKI